MKKISLPKKNNIEKIGIITIIVSIFFISIGYSSFRRDLPISNVSAYVDVQSKIKVMSFDMIESSSQESYSNSVSHSNSSISTNIHLNDSSSWVKYEIYVVNIGNEEMGIAKILETTLSDDLTYEISHYNLKEPICDEEGDNCTLDAKEKIDILIKYKDGITITDAKDYQVLLEFDFEPFYDVTYGTDTCSSGCAIKAIANTSFYVNLLKYNTLIVKMNGNTLTTDSYTLNKNTGLLTINNVIGDINISNKLYTRLLYIESTGTTDKQYIDLDYIPKKTTKVIYDGMTISGDTALVASRDSISNAKGKFTLQYVSNNVYRYSYYNNDYLASSSVKIGDRHTFTISSSQFLIDNVLVSLVTDNENFENYYNLYAFAVNTNGVASNFGQNRTYGIKIYENNDLVRNYVPVLDNNNVACLYEIIENKFYYNKGAGIFNAGQTQKFTITNNIENVSFSNTNTIAEFASEYSTYLTSSTGFEIPEILRIKSDGNLLTLNDDYTYDSVTGKLVIFEVTGNITVAGAITKQIPYILSTGTQYIDTEYLPTINTKVIFTHIPITTNSSGWVAYFGCRDGNNNNDAFYFSTGKDLVSAYVGSIHIGNANPTYNHILGTEEVITLSASGFTLVSDGEIKLNYTNDVSKVTFTKPNTIYIFGRSVGTGEVNYPSNVKLVSFQIYEDNILVRDFIPIIDADGEYGLYETLHGKYYYNKGTGLFSE